MYGVMTTDSDYFGLVIEYFELGDVRMLLDAKEETPHISIDQKSQILLDIAEVKSFATTR